MSPRVYSHTKPLQTLPSPTPRVVAGSGAVEPGGFVPPLLAVKTQAVCNDPTLKVSTRNGGRTVMISGIGSNNGFMASSVRLSFDGKTVSVPVSTGEKPGAVFEAISAALPKGFELKSIPTRTGVAFTVMKKMPTEQPGPFPTMNRIHDLFETARAQGKVEGRISAPELQHIVDAAMKGGLSLTEKRQLAQEWAAQFDGATVNATGPAKELYARLQKELGLPVIFVR